MERILRRQEIEAATGLQRSTLYMLMAKGEFPRPIKLTDRAVGWPETLIKEWIQSKITQTNPDANPAKEGQSE